MNWPTRSIKETLEILTAPGAPFEMQEETVRGRRLRTYVNAASDLKSLLDASRRYGNRDFLVYEDDRVSFEGHWRAANAFARVLQDTFGITKGDRIAIAMRNYPEWSVCSWGILSLGAIMVPLNAWETGKNLAHMLSESGARLVVLDEERFDRLEGAVPSVERVLVRSSRVGRSLEDLIGPVSEYSNLPDVPAPGVDLQPDDFATMFFTSGTTGKAKGAMGTHRNILTNLVNVAFRPARAAVRRGGAIPPPPDPATHRVQMLPLPLFHVTGFHANLVPCLHNGSTLVLMRKWDPEMALDLIERERVTGISTVPAVSWQLVEAAEAHPEKDISSVDTIAYGGAAAAPALAGKIRRLFPNAFPAQGYGATETSSLMASNSHEDMMLKPGSVGIAVPCCDLRVVDTSGNDVAQGETGELWVRGPQVVFGYWNRPDATEAAFSDGWYRTGDIVVIDEEGFITLLDRAKDMLIRGGENIYCVEIEDLIATHPYVAECAVFGIPDRVLGEVVAATVRTRPGREISAQAIMDYTGQHLSAYKVPVKVQVTKEPLPRNAAGKTLKKEIRATLLASIAADG